MDIDLFKERMDRMIEDLKGLPRMEGEERIYVHGEIEFEHEEDRRKTGIPLNPNVVRSLENVAEDIGVPFDP